MQKSRPRTGSDGCRRERRRRCGALTHGGGLPATVVSCFRRPGCAGRRAAVEGGRFGAGDSQRASGRLDTPLQAACTGCQGRMQCTPARNGTRQGLWAAWQSSRSTPRSAQCLKTEQTVPACLWAARGRLWHSSHTLIERRSQRERAQQRSFLLAVHRRDLQHASSRTSPRPRPSLSRGPAQHPQSPRGAPCGPALDH